MAIWRSGIERWQNLLMGNGIRRGAKLRTQRRRRGRIERLEARRLLVSDMFEPNDSMEDPYNVSQLWGLFRGQGYVETGNSDWFSFSLDQTPTSDHGITLSFSHAVGDLELALYNSQGDLIRSSTSLTDTEFVSFDGLQPDAYFFQVYGYQGASGGYELRIDSPESFIPPDANEYNNVASSATDLTALDGEFELTQQSLHSVNDQDFYRFHLGSAGGPDHYLGALVLDFNGITALEVLDENLNPLYVSTSDVLHYVSLDGYAEGDYYVFFYSFETLTSDYRLAFNLPSSGGTQSDYLEPNNNQESASSLGMISGTYSTTLSIHSAQDEDWLQFEIAEDGVAGHEIAIDFSHSIGDLDIALYDSGINYIGASTGITNREQISLAGLSAGTYYLKVYGYNGATNPSYLLTIVAPEVGIAADDYESNDTRESAYQLGAVAGDFMVGGLTIDSATDEDWFQFDLSAEGTTVDEVRIEFSHAFGDLDMSLYNGAGDWVGNSSGVSDEEVISLQGLAAGSYLVRVYGYSDATSPSYVLSIHAPELGIQPDEFEPNDERGAASNLGLLDGQRYWLLNLDEPGESDWLKFQISTEATADHYITTYFTHELGDIDMELFDEQGNRVSGSASVEDSETISLAGFTAGIYYLHIYGYSGATSPGYILEITAPAAGGGADRLEPNNALASATDMRVVTGSSNVGGLSIHESGDEDWVRFETVAAGTAADYVSIDFTHSVGDLDIVLYDAGGTPLLYSTGIGNEERISLEGLSAGAYFLRVFGYSGATNPDYALTIRAPEGGITPDYLEPNNSFATATDLRQLSGVFEHALSIHSDTDADWFRLELATEGGVHDFIETTFAHSLGDIDMVLYDANEMLVSASTGVLDSERISLEGLGRGVYYLHVYGYSGAINPGYVLQVEVEEPTTGGDRFEDNNTLLTATDLRGVTGELVRDDLSIHVAGDEDWFRFETTATGTETSFAKVSFEHRLGDIDVVLYDSQGVPLRTSAGTSDEELIEFTGLPAGVYYLHVYGYSGAVNPDYSLTISPPVAGFSPDRLEPNNDSTSAFVLRNQGDLLIGDYREHELSLHSSADVDYFRFTTTATGVAGNHVSVIGVDTQADLSVLLYNSQLQLVSGGAASVSLQDLAAGTYYARVSSASGVTTRYSLSIDAPRAAAELDPWTILVYITASDLQQYAFEDINEMERALVDLPSNVNIAVYWDQSSALTKYPSGGGTQAAWGTVGYAMLQADRNMNSVATTFTIETEANTGTPEPLVDFMRWATTTAPAENYALVMWDHGGGIYGSNYDTADGPSRDNLTISELTSALTADGVPRMDLISFDACLMAMTEVAYKMAGVTDYFVSSQEVVGARGHDYTTLFEVLESNPQRVTAEQLAAGFVASYEDQYGGGGSEWDTHSALRLSNMSGLVNALATFTHVGLTAGSQALTAIRSAIDAAISYSDPEFRDLGTMMRAIAGDSRATAALQNAAGAVLTQLDGMLVSLADDVRHSSGLSIFVPDRGVTGNFYTSEFGDLDAAIGWSQFMSTVGNRAGGAGGRLGRAVSTRDWAEANDIPGLAFNLHRLAGSDLLFDQLSLHTSYDVDWFRFNMDAGTAGNQLTLKGATGVSLNLKLYDAAANTVIASVSGEGDLMVDLSGLAAGTYLVRVDGPQISSSAPYALEFDTPAVVGGGDWAGGNGSRDKAYPLGMLTTQTQLTGLRLNGASEDWFRIDTPRFAQASHYSITVDTPSTADVIVQVVDANGDVVSETQGNGRLVAGYRASGAAEQYWVRIVNGDNQDSMAYQARVARATEGIYELVIPERVAGGLIGELDLSAIYENVGDVVLSDNRFEWVNNQLRLRPGNYLNEGESQQVWLQVNVQDGSGTGSETSLVLPVAVEPNSTPLQNRNLVWDVDADGIVTPRDALIVINDLQRNGARPVTFRDGSEGTRYILPDVSGDNLVLPIDALKVINYLNRQANGEGSGAEGEAIGVAGASHAPGAAWDQTAWDQELARRAASLQAGSVDAYFSDYDQRQRGLNRTLRQA